ncbi:MAG TPA: Fur family transcriptional regulator [Spirochaetia bacterium]|nr:Fur family transcriptional regulator [Spirochaetia bacterium]
MKITLTMDQSEHFRDYLRRNGLAFTTSRRTILTWITEATGHFDTEELRESLARHGRKLSPATIYRTLPLFVRSGIIKETIRTGDKARYEHVYGHEHHDHLECLRCGRIIEFMDPGLERLQEKVCRKHRFTPVEHRLAIRGYCSRCMPRKGRRG